MTSDGVGTQRELMRIPEYRHLIAGWIISNLGDSALYITASIWVKVVTGSDGMAGAVFIAMGLSSFAAPFLGNIVDAHSRKRLIVLSNVTTGLVILVLLLLDASTIWLVYPVMVLYSCSSVMNSSAQNGLVRDLLPPRLFAPANGLLTSLDQALRIGSPMLGALVFSVWGIAPVIIGTTACYLVGALIVSRLRVTESAVEVEQVHFVERTLEGFRRIGASPALAASIIAVSIVMGASGLTNVTIFATVEQGLGLDEEFLTVIIAVQGACAVVAGLLAAQIIARIGLAGAIIAGTIAFGLTTLSTATSSVALVLIGAGIGGAGITIMIVAIVTQRQQLLPARVQGRGGAAMNLAMNGAQVLFSTAAAVLVGGIDYRILIVVSAVICAAAVVPLLLARRGADAVVETTDALETP